MKLRVTKETFCLYSGQGLGSGRVPEAPALIVDKDDRTWETSPACGSAHPSLHAGCPWPHKLWSQPKSPPRLPESLAPRHMERQGAGLGRHKGETQKHGGGEGSPVSQKGSLPNMQESTMRSELLFLKTQSTRRRLCRTRLPVRFSSASRQMKRMQRRAVALITKASKRLLKLQKSMNLTFSKVYRVIESQCFSFYLICLNIF